MKIGILTYTREFANLGTNMQAYCTLRAVQQAYPHARVELIDYSPSAPSMKPYVSAASLGSLRNDWVRMRKYKKFFNEHLTFSNEKLVTTDSEQALSFIGRQGYDAIYVGSDTVLEMKGAQADGITPFWLDRAIPGVKVLAAASSHSVTFENLSPRQRDSIASSLEAFKLLGVRDHATYRLISEFVSASDKRLQIVPDPTFTYDIDYSHIERYLAARKLKFTAPMVCLHLLRDSAWGSALADAFRAAGYIVASLRPARYADIIFTDLSPFEQLGLYKYFSVVVTHRFHDAIFCLKNLTPVIAFPENVSDVTHQGESKIATLLSAFDLHSSSYIPNKTMLDAEYLFKRHNVVMADFERKRANIQAVLADYRERYRSFIEQSRRFLS